jgi:hypothetical protein
MYRFGDDPAGYERRLCALVAEAGKPVVVTEFGCSAHVGADRRGPGSFLVVNWFAQPPRIRDGHVRDEGVQAAYLAELIDLYADADVHGCFVFTFAMPDFPHHPDPRNDLDMAGFGVVKAQPDGRCEPKKRSARWHAGTPGWNAHWVDDAHCVQLRRVQPPGAPRGRDLRGCVLGREVSAASVERIVGAPGAAALAEAVRARRLADAGKAPSGCSPGCIVRRNRLQLTGKAGYSRAAALRGRHTPVPGGFARLLVL